MKTQKEIEDKRAELETQFKKAVGDGHYSFKSEQYYKVKALQDLIIALDWVLQESKEKKRR